MRDGFKLLGPHVKGCFAAENKDGLTFIVHDRDRPYDFRRKKNGNRGGGTMWHRFVCNDTSCNAVLLVRWDVLTKFINGEHDD